MAATSTDGKPTNLWAFLNTLVSIENQPPCSVDDEQAPPWYESEKVYEINEKTYWHYLEILPPRWIHGKWFAFGEGAGPFRLFWQIRDAYFLRELTDDETRTFCELSGVALYE